MSELLFPRYVYKLIPWVVCESLIQTKLSVPVDLGIATTLEKAFMLSWKSSGFAAEPRDMTLMENLLSNHETTLFPSQFYLPSPDQVWCSDNHGSICDLRGRWGILVISVHLLPRAVLVVVLSR